MTHMPASATSPPIHPATWPYPRLDLDELRRDGWRPTPLREFVLKVHQRCNLACDYCYVYELADQSWRDRPRLMPPAVWRAAARRIGEHVRAHDLDHVTAILHGGEPLLAGVDRLCRAAAGLRAEMPGSCELTIGLQSNGVLLDEPTLTRLAGEDIRIGVSVDGSPDDHDRHRRFRDGRGSHDAVARALSLLNEPRFHHLYAGLLCTVDVEADPIGTYEQLLRHRPPSIDFLLPHANWATPPHRPPEQPAPPEQPPPPKQPAPHTPSAPHQQHAPHARPATPEQHTQHEQHVRSAPHEQAAPHGRWLATVFDRWYAAPRRETRIRLFEEIMSLVLGGTSRSEQVGTSPAAAVVIESDGTIEQVDSLKSAYHGACHTGLNVIGHPFDLVLEHPGFVARQIGLRALSDECLRCPIHRVCGAGHYAHRYRPGAGFRNPTVYCADMLLLIGHVQHRVTTDLAAAS